MHLTRFLSCNHGKIDRQENPIKTLYNHLYDAGEVYSLIREYEKSKPAFEKALAINEALFEEEPDNPIYEINHAETFEKYAKLLSKLGTNEDAEDYIIKSNEIYRKLAEEDSSEGDIDEEDI